MSQDLPPPLSPLCLQEKIKTMFEQLVLVDHPNIVKLHKYWLDVKDSKARVGRSGGCSPGWGGMSAGGDGDPGSVPHSTPQDSHPPGHCCWAGGWEADASLPSQVIFITEYVSSGSLKQFLKKTKKNHKAMNARVGSWEHTRGVPGGMGSSVATGRGSVISCKAGQV